MSETMRVLVGTLSVVDNVHGTLSEVDKITGVLSKEGGSLFGSISPIETIQGSLSTTEVIKDPYYEVDNSYGTTIYIGE